MNIAETKEKYNNYVLESKKYWNFSNEILYRMCRENPYHTDDDIIAGKVMLIGRSYAASVERRKTKDNLDADAFYYERVTKSIKSIKNLDDRIKELNMSSEFDLASVLSLHKDMVDALEKITSGHVQSFSSKYLHFHCPNSFFLYDERARKRVTEIVGRVKGNLDMKDVKPYDTEYARFVCKMRKLQNGLGLHITPRELDDFLLYGEKSEN